jgi:Na+/citrate or Na+/malate symporter
MWSKLRPQDLIAALVICVCGTLLGLGKDHIVGIALLAVVGGYYGVDISPLGDILRRKNGKDGTNGRTK